MDIYTEAENARHSHALNNLIQITTEDDLEAISSPAGDSGRASV
jgi:hypothetical protein